MMLAKDLHEPVLFNDEMLAGKVTSSISYHELKNITLATPVQVLRYAFYSQINHLMDIIEADTL